MDWISLIAELVRLGYTQPKIATACHCGQATISDLANGKSTEPRHALGEDLKHLLETARAEKAKAEKAGVQ